MAPIMTSLTKATAGPALADRLAGGEWITPPRLRAYAIGLIAIYAAFLAVGVIGGAWLVDGAGNVQSTDFISFWSAGRLALAGAASTAYDIAHPTMMQQLALGHATAREYYWFYPPSFLLVVTPFALLPYLPSLFLWLALTLIAYLAAIYAIRPGRITLLLALAAPTVCANVITGQTGFLCASLLGGGLLLLDSEPVSAGVLIGLLAIKPQLALLIPVVLIATRRWRAVAAAAATAGSAVILSGLLLGWDSWTAFINVPASASQALLQQGTVGLFKIQSLYAVVRVLGAAAPLAWLAQAGASMVIAFAVLKVWWRELPYGLKAAALATGGLMVTPYAMIYDLALLAVPVAFLVREGEARGFLAWEKPALVGIGLLPILFLWVPQIGVVTEAALMVLILRRARVAAITVA